jgi:hypothetical protein
MNRRAANETVDAGNPFHAARDEEECRDQVLEAIERMRSDYRHDCQQLEQGARGRNYGHLPELIRILSGAEFENTFPPVREAGPGGSDSDAA